MRDDFKKYQKEHTLSNKRKKGKRKLQKSFFF